MKKLLSILSVLLLLSGCGAFPSSTAKTTEPFIPTDSECTTSSCSSLLDNMIPLGDQALYQIQNEAIDQLGAFGDFLIFKDCLLVTRMEFPEPSEEEPEPQDLDLQNSDNQLIDSIPIDVLLIDLTTGEKRASAHFTGESYTSVQAAGDYIVLSNWDRGTVRILDKNLKEVRRVDTLPSWCLNHLDASCQYVYCSTDQKDLVRFSTATGEPETVIPPTLLFSVNGIHRDGISLNYLDRTSQKYHNLYLDLHTGSLEKIPFPQSYSYADCVNGLWLAASKFPSNTYHLGRSENFSVIEDGSTSFSLIDGPAPLYSMQYGDENSQIMNLYGEDGTSVGKLVNETGSGYLSEPQWCDALDGYFLSCFMPDNSVYLLFWDIDKAQKSENLTLKHIADTEAVPSKDHILSAEVYDRAEEISEKYHVNIKTGEQCASQFQNMATDTLENNDAALDALSALETALSSYPDGFMQQLLFGDFQQIEINIVDGIHPLDVPENANGFTEFAAFVLHENGKHILVFSADNHNPVQTFYHEFSHIIDEKLHFLSIYENSLYSHSRWEALNPEGFQYSYDLYNLPDSIYSTDYDAYFVDMYARTFPTEDRARILEYAMSGHAAPFESAHTREKLAYYSAGIRDCFDTTSWPEETLWEKPLNGYRFDAGRLQELDSIAAYDLLPDA